MQRWDRPDGYPALLHNDTGHPQSLWSPRRDHETHSSARRTAVICYAVLLPSPLILPVQLVHVFVDDTTVALSCIIVDVEKPATVTSELTTFHSYPGRCFLEHPLHPSADRPFALKQTAATVSCNLHLRVVTGHSFMDRVKRWALCCLRC
jgi:hypothetical protein